LGRIAAGWFSSVFLVRGIIAWEDRPAKRREAAPRWSSALWRRATVAFCVIAARLRMAAICLADSSSTAVRHEASNSRIDSLSISPTRCSPAAVSWIAADRRPRYLPALFFFAKHLLQFRPPSQSVRCCNLEIAAPAFSGHPTPRRRCFRVRSWRSPKGTRCAVTPDRRSPCDSRPSGRRRAKPLSERGSAWLKAQSCHGPRLRAERAGTKGASKALARQKTIAEAAVRHQFELPNLAGRGEA
jgi:hypothetical protein